MKKTITWIVVADGTQAHVFESRGPGKRLTIVSDLDWSIPPMQSQDIGSDRPGRTFASSGTHRSAKVPSSDPAKHREDEFVREFADALDRKAQQGAFDRLIIAAAPAALGTLRKSLSDHVRGHIVAELDKDLTNVPTPKLGKHFKDVLAA